MSDPAVSVIIPTRNRAGMLPVAIQSALTQTFRDLEVVVVDDASDDGTPQVVSGFNDPRLRYLRQKTRSGGAAARNAGISSALGEYIAFLDDDDEWSPEKLDLQIGLLRRSPDRVGIVYSSYVVLERETGRVIGRKVAQRRGDLSKDLPGRNFLGGTSAVVVRRACFLKSGLFDESLPSFQDYDLWIRMSRDFEFDFIDRDLLKYYVHGKSIWSDLDALERGIVLMFQKHGSSASSRRNLAGQSLRVGIRYCSRGQIRQGQKALVRALRWDPTRLMAYLNLIFSCLGARSFRAAHDLKRRLRGGPGDGESARAGVSSRVAREVR